MNTKRLRFVLFAIPVCLISVLIIGAQRSHPANAGGVIDPTCTSSLPCIEYDNNGTGPGIRGVSLSGNGSNGITKVNSTSAASGREGVFGNDMSTSGIFNSGIRGLSVRGTGVLGNSTSGLGVSGTSSSNTGVFGSSSSGYGVIGATGSSTFFVAGIQGNNNGSTIAVRANGFGGPLFVGNNNGGFDVFTVDNAGKLTLGAGAAISGGVTVGLEEFVTGTPGTDALFAGTSASSRGVVGEGLEGVAGFGEGTAPFGVVAFNQASSGGEALAVQDLSGTGVLIAGFDSSSDLEFGVADDGTVTAHAYLTGLATSAGPKVTTYANQSSTPTVEDFGEAQLTVGQTYVSLERTFAAAIDSRSAYMVFITPEGDTRGLYVTQKTPAGFAVRENQGGRSTVAFSYRIVAKPYGSTAARLALVPQSRRDLAPPHQMPHLRTVPALHYVPKWKTGGQ
jgi:hypothetical protein